MMTLKRRNEVLDVLLDEMSLTLSKFSNIDLKLERIEPEGDYGDYDTYINGTSDSYVVKVYDMVGDLYDTIKFYKLDRNLGDLDIQIVKDYIHRKFEYFIEGNLK